jgi:hypothetical protein
MKLRLAIMSGIVVASAAFADVQTGADSSFQVRYASNLQFGESYINIINTGSNGAPLYGPGFGGTTGNICVNVYAFDWSESLIACCSCVVTPDQVVSLGVNRDLTSRTLTGVIPTSVTVKLFSTLETGGTCSNSATAVNASSTGVRGMAAWGTTLHATPKSGTYAVTETAFTPATFSGGELTSIGGRCTFIVGNASGFGICASCRTGAIGAQKM